MRPFVDAHHHFWDLSLPGYNFWKVYRSSELAQLKASMEGVLGPYETICQDFLPADLARIGKPIGLQKSVHIETTSPGEWLVEANWIETLHKATGYPGAHIAACNLTEAGLEARIAQLKRNSTFRGIRSITFIDSALLYKQEFWDGLAVLEAHDLILDADFDWTVFPVLSEIARTFPKLRIVLGHAGFPKFRTDLYFSFWAKALKQLAAHDQLYCKISGFGMVDHNWSKASIRPWVDMTIACFGPERVMFGSNWPVDSLFSTYKELWDAYFQLTAGFSDADQNAMFVKNAEQFYRI